MQKIAITMTMVEVCNYGTPPLKIGLFLKGDYNICYNWKMIG